MGNENSSMCGCYDNDAERLKSETAAFGGLRPDSQKMMQKKQNAALLSGFNS